MLRTPVAAESRSRSEVRAARTRAVLSTGEPYAFAEVAGEDRRDFLQNQLPVDVSSLAGRGAYTAYLDRKGRITHDLILTDLGDRYGLFAPRERLGSLLSKLEEHHFRERVTFSDLSAVFAVRELHGPAVPVLLARAAGMRVPADSFATVSGRVEGVPVTFTVDPWTGDPGGHLLVLRDGLSRAEQALAAGEAVLAGDDGLEILRIEGGRPRFGADMDERTLLPELGFPDMVSYRKGCYLGQETVARIHARGHVNRLLLGLELDGDHVPEPGTVVLAGEEPAGETRSACWSPSLDRPIALAVLRPKLADAGAVVHVRLPTGLVPARVRELPFYRTPGPKEAAEGLYREGQAAFRGDRYEDALGRFERAVLLDPSRLDALEAAGICQERLGRMEEARETMQSIVDADPEHVMAWTNLSRYLAQEGNLEEAERIKGRVTALLWKREAGERAARRQAAEDEAARRSRLESRIALFREVLALDPDDLVAHFGLGKVLLDLERWEESAASFRNAITRDRDYSAAFDHLATALLRMGRSEEAAEVLRAGIEAASRRGDLMPKRSMARKLAELEVGTPGSEPPGPGGAL